MLWSILLVKCIKNSSCVWLFKIWQSYMCANANFYTDSAVWQQCLHIDASQSQLFGLALDIKQQLLYYTDHIQGIIAEITTSGSHRREIFSNRRTNPYAIVVDDNSRWTNSHMSHYLDRSERYIVFAIRVFVTWSRRSVVLELWSI